MNVDKTQVKGYFRLKKKAYCVVFVFTLLLLIFLQVSIAYVKSSTQDALPIIDENHINPEALKLINELKAKGLSDDRIAEELRKLGMYFIDPVTLKISEFRAQGFSGAQITEELEKLGTGWWPETGATWIGTRPTSEESERLPPRIWPYGGTPPEFPLSTRLIQAGAVMETREFSYTGVQNQMKLGSIAVSSGKTIFHIVTTHFGKPIGSLPKWTEVGVARDLNYNPASVRFFTYDNDEGGYVWHGQKTNVETYDFYKIIIIGYSPTQGYTYNIFINGYWKRTGHLPYDLNIVDQANEVWSDTGQWTSDTSYALHKLTYLQKPSGTWVAWNSGIPTRFRQWPSPSYPVKYRTTNDNVAYNYYTWVGP